MPLDLPPVSMEDCPTEVYFSEIEEVYIALSTADPFTDFSSAAEWNARLALPLSSHNAIRALYVVGDKPAPTPLKKVISQNREVIIGKTHLINFDIDETNDINYEAMRKVQCGGLMKIWYSTRGYHLFGGNAGLLVSIDAFDVLARGDELQKFQYTATWKNINDPDRTMNPLYVTSNSEAGIFESQFESQFE